MMSTLLCDAILVMSCLFKLDGCVVVLDFGLIELHLMNVES